MTTLREQFDPLIRAYGLNEVARRATELTGVRGINPAMLSGWLNRKGPRQPSAEQLEAIARALGREVVVRKAR